MLVAVILVVELLAIYLCVNRMYGKKLKFDFLTVVTFVAMFSIMAIVNRLDLSGSIAFLSYIVFIIYCIFAFKDRIIPTIITAILSVIMVAVIEFCYAVLCSFIVWKYLGVRDIIGCIIPLLIVIFVFPICKIERLRESICKRHWLMYIILLFAVLVSFTTLILFNLEGSVQIGFFIFGIPAIAIILFLVIYWDKSMAKEMQMKKELIVLESMQNEYEDLVVKVKENQHGLKNHMMAVMSSHYTYKTYEQLVEAQQEYCGKMQDENKYNSLLFIGNHTIGGFLYGKIREIESKGVKITYKIETKIDSCHMPYYYIVEILGILLDNATEAVQSEWNDGGIHIVVAKANNSYKFVIRNTFPETGYETIAKWFELGHTTKDKGQGIGLAQVRKLCDEWQGKITCKNQNIEGTNWIVFELCLDAKKDAE